VTLRAGAAEPSPAPAEQAGARRVLEDVEPRGVEVLLRLDHPRFEACAEEVTAAVVAAVEALRVDAVQASHAVREQRLRREDKEVEVVRHQRPHVELPAVAPDGVVEQLLPVIRVERVEHDRPALHATRGDVVHRRRRQARAGSAHLARVRTARQPRNPLLGTWPRDCPCAAEAPAAARPERLRQPARAVRDVSVGLSLTAACMSRTAALRPPRRAGFGGRGSGH